VQGAEEIKREFDMATIGTVESLWRYPVKSMSGKAMTEVFMGFSGFYLGRRFAFKNSAAPTGHPYLTARLQQSMLRYRPQFRYPERAAKALNLTAAVRIAPGVMPVNGDPHDLILDVVTPSGEVVAVDDPVLVEMLSEGIGEKNRLTLMHSDRGFLDCRPVSLISLQTVWHLEAEVGIPIDKRRFRANIYLHLAAAYGFAEDELVGRKLRIGSRAVMMVLERDPRCKMISLDPDTGAHNPEVLRKVARAHATFAGVYGAVLVEGSLKESDAIELLD
jgi:uncharacterized protein YcbX